jgi:hypothetical protein
MQAIPFTTPIRANKRQVPKSHCHGNDSECVSVFDLLEELERFYLQLVLHLGSNDSASQNQQLCKRPGIR